MASAARAYTADRLYEPQQREAARPDLRVVPGEANENRPARGISPLYLRGFKLLVVAVIAICCIGIGRVWLINATTSALIESKTINTNIAQARSNTNVLEVQQTILANADRIQLLASENLGMAPAANTENLDLSNGVLSVDAQGSLSLNGSIAALDSSSQGNYLVADASNSESQ